MPLLNLKSSEITSALGRIRSTIVCTPFMMSRTLSEICGAEIWVKFENLQFTASFKERGALNKLLLLTAEERERGVIAMSAGNHAQGLAYHAARLRIPTTIVMPEGTPFSKVKQTQMHGATVIQHGETLAEARAEMERIAAEKSLVVIHPYDDPAIIAGQGTIGIEMIDAMPEGQALDDIVVPIGGGGLIAGNALAFAAKSPKTQIVGVEAELYPSMKRALGDPHARPGRGAAGGATIAEGIAVTEVGSLTLEICRAHVNEVVLVSEAQIERAIYLFLTVEKTLAEGAGAAGLAAVIANPKRFEGRRVGLILCGGNIDPRLLSSVILRELMREGQICQIEVDIVDLPGALAKISGLIGAEGGSILEVQHSRTTLELPAKVTRLDLVFEARDPTHAEAILAAIAAAGYSFRRRTG